MYINFVFLLFIYLFQYIENGLCCVDKRPDCKRLSTHGLCEKRKSLMENLCKNTCNMCQIMTVQPVLKFQQQVARDQPQYSGSTIVARTDCRDRRKNCVDLKSMGRCETSHKAMSALCKRTCNMCKNSNKLPFFPQNTQKLFTTCADKDDRCPKLANYGWCESRKTWMETYCSKTCQFCGANYVDPNTVRWVPPTRSSVVLKGAQKSNGICEDELRNCAQLKSKGWCERSSQMKTKCQNTCNFCETSEESCRDKKKGCSQMKKMGLCKTRKSVMKSICQSTCELCEEKPHAETKQQIKLPLQGRYCRNRYPVARCRYYSHMGWCEKNNQIRENCYSTCVCTQAPVKTTMKTKILVCKDDARFDRLCGRFGSDCDSSGSLGASLRKYCPKTCSIC